MVIINACKIQSYRNFVWTLEKDTEDLEDTIILFVAGSDKSGQKKVIQQANKYFEDYLERNVNNDSNK